MDPRTSIPLYPEQASTYAPQHDILFGILTALTVIFTIIVFLMVLTFVNKYRRGRPADRSNPVNDHLKVELTWTIIPLILALGVYTYSAYLYVGVRTFPKNAAEVFVIGKQWMWHIQHANGIRENNELTVPVGVPTKLTMISQDVIHAFYVPAFRMQYHVTPGRYTAQWFEATKPGRYHLFCTIHCGNQHSEMVGYVNVLTPTAYAKWVETRGNRFKNQNMTVVEKGKDLFDTMRCGSCHGAKSDERGPSLHSIYGSKRNFADGTSGVADADYLRWSIIDPYRKINKGYSNTMPLYEYKKQIQEEDLLALIEYMKTLGTGSSQPATTTVPAAQ